MFDRLPRTRSRCTFSLTAISTTSLIWKLIGVEAVKTVQKAYDTSLETIGHVSQIVEQLFQRTRTAVI